jgi:hypothetical protein
MSNQGGTCKILVEHQNEEESIGGEVVEIVTQGKHVRGTSRASAERSAVTCSHLVTTEISKMTNYSAKIIMI